MNEKNTDNKILEATNFESEIKNEEVEEYQEVILTKEMLEELGLSDEIEEPNSDMVPLPIFELNLDELMEMPEFQEGKGSVAKLCAEIIYTSNVGLPPLAYIQHIEQMAVIEMNKEIAKTNLEASKNIKKEIDVKTEDNSL